MLKSVAASDAGSGYAYVCYLRDDKKVPVSFIKSFRQPFDSKKQYLVFWGNDEGDSPDAVLQRQATIPIAGDKDETTDAGYYPATVLIVSDTLEELDKMISQKRVHKPTSKVIKDASFSTSPKGTKRKSSLSSDSAGKSQHGSKKLKESPVEKREVRAIVSQPGNASYFFKMAHGKLNKAGGQSLRNTDEHSHLRGTASKKGRKVSSSSADSGSNNSSSDADPDFSPRKFRILKQDLVIKESKSRRVRELNLKLQEKLFKLEAENKAYREYIDNNGPFAVSDRNTGSLDPLELCSVSFKAGSVTNTNNAIKAGLMNNSNGAIKEVGLPVSMDKLDDAVKPESLNNSDDAVKPGSLSNSDDAVKDATSLQTSADPKTREPVPNSPQTSTDPALSTPMSTSTPKDVSDTEEPLRLSKGIVLKEDVLKILWEETTGDKGDSMFIKNAAVAVFGSDHLASHVVKGIKKTSKTDQESETAKRPVLPALDRDVLRDIRRLLQIGVFNEKGDPKGDRCKEALINKFLHEKIKSLRSSGFGKK